MVNRTQGFYHEFKIPKRRGGFRRIEVPSPSLLNTQKWILINILENIELHVDAFGFRKNISIIDNANKHLGCSYLLKMDLKDFFPSINVKRVINVFLRSGYAPNVSYYLAKLCCNHERLPQGAATSPYLSNIIAKKLDARIRGLCDLNKWSYSRYADDIAISGEFISPRVISIISDIILSEGFKTNNEKTVLVKGNGKKIVTGLSVVGEKVTLPRKYKRDLKKEIHFINRFGMVAHCEYIGVRDPVYLDRLEGRVRFWLSIEPENSQALRALSVLRKEDERLRNNVVT